MTAKETKKGQMVSFTQTSSPTEMQVWVKDSYDRETKKYIFTCFGDISKSKLVAGSKAVFTEFTF